MNDHRLESGGFGGWLKSAMSAKAEPVPAEAGLRRRGCPVRGSLPLNGEGRIVVMTLIGEVRFDHLIGDRVTAAAKIAPRPAVSSPIPLPIAANSRNSPYELFPFNGCTRRLRVHLRRNRQQHLHVIRRDVPLQDIHPLPPAFCPGHVLHPFRDCSPPHLVGVRGDPHHMKVDGEHRMRTRAIVIRPPRVAIRKCSSFRLKAGVLSLPIGDKIIETQRKGDEENRDHDPRRRVRLSQRRSTRGSVSF